MAGSLSTRSRDEPRSACAGRFPSRSLGMGVYEVAEESELRDMLDRDPANGLLQYESFPMPRAVVAKRSA